MAQLDGDEERSVETRPRHTPRIGHRIAPMPAFDTDPPDGAAPLHVDGQSAVPDRVQCPNCCRLAPVTRRETGLLFYRCELCFTVGALPDDGSLPKCG